MKNILEYNLTQDQLNYLEKAGIINDCGGKGGTDFNSIIKSNLKHIKLFNEEKGVKLFEDIKQICNEHDLEFFMKKGFYKSNYRMCKKVYKLLRSAKVEWISKKQSFVISLIIYILLNKYGKSFYYIKK